jgi:hypothetical protein
VGTNSNPGHPAGGEKRRVAHPFQNRKGRPPKRFFRIECATRLGHQAPKRFLRIECATRQKPEPGVPGELNASPALSFHITPKRAPAARFVYFMQGMGYKFLPMSKIKTVVRDVAAVLVIAALAILVEHYVSVKLAWLTVLIGCLVLLWLHELHKPIGMWLLVLWVNHKPSLILICVVVLVLFGVGITISRFRLPSDSIFPLRKPPKIDFPPTMIPVPKAGSIRQEPLTLKELFQTDFGSRMSSNEGTFPLIIGSKSGKFPDVTYTFTARLYFDMEGGTQFFAFYIPRQDRDPEEASKKTVVLCKELPSQFSDLLKQLHGLESIEPHTTGSTLKSSELSFSRRVFIYHEDFITPPYLGDLVREYEAKQLLPEFRGDEYLSSQRLLRALGQRK